MAGMLGSEFVLLYGFYLPYVSSLFIFHTPTLLEKGMNSDSFMNVFLPHCRLETLLFGYFLYSIFLYSSYYLRSSY